MPSLLPPPQTTPWPAPGDPVQFWPALLVSCASILLGAGCLLVLLRRLGCRGLGPAAWLALGLSGGGLLIVALALPVLLWARAWQVAPDFRAVFGLLAAGLALGTATLYFRTERPAAAAWLSRTALLLLLLAAGLGWLRLAFVGSLLLPPYNDSVEHTLIVRDLLRPAAAPDAFYSLDMAARYYHFGFHVLAAWVSALSGAQPSSVLPVLGQVLQVLIPLALFFPARAATGSDAAALFCVLLAGLGWRMPAFASNWGKYPALAGLAGYPFALGTAWLAGQAADGRQRRALLALALAGALLATLMHTRSAVLLFCALAAWWSAGRVLRAGPLARALVIVLLVALAGALALRVYADAGLRSMLDPYLRDGLLASLLVLLLAPHGLRRAPQASLAALLALLLLLLAALTPMPDFLARLGYQTLLDRPFAQIALFAPLALLGAAGLAGLQRTLESGPRWNRPLWKAVSCGLCLALLPGALLSDTFLPASCCRLVTRDDLSAYAWMQANLPPEAVVLVAVERTPSQSYGVDGGVWITPLTGLQTRRWPHQVLFDTQEVLQEICARGVTYVYAGGTSSRFSVELLASQPRWYENVFTLPGAYLYKLVGCPVTPS